MPEYTAFGPPQRVTIQGYSGHAMEPFITCDGRYLLFNNRNEPQDNTNLHYAIKKDVSTFVYKGEIRGVNTASLEGVATMDRNGVFYFVSNRSYEKTFSTVYRGKFKDGAIKDVEIVPGISKQILWLVNFDVEISPDGNDLYFVDSRFAPGKGPQTADLVISHRKGNSFVRDPKSSEIMHNINTPALQYAACISANGLELFFTRYDLQIAPAPCIYRAARKNKHSPFDLPQRVNGIVGFVEGPTLSPDEKTLYYHKKDGERFVLYKVTRKHN